MEIPNIPELNQSTLEEKADSEQQQKNLSLPDLNPRLKFKNLGQVIWLAVITVGLVVFLFDHVIGHNLGAYGQNTVPPVNSRVSVK